MEKRDGGEDTGGGACMYPTKQIDRDDRKRPGGFEPLETVGCEHIGKQTL